jgi:hypothetical protein
MLHVELGGKRIIFHAASTFASTSLGCTISALPANIGAAVLAGRMVGMAVAGGFGRAVGMGCVGAGVGVGGTTVAGWQAVITSAIALTKKTNRFM